MKMNKQLELTRKAQLDAFNTLNNYEQTTQPLDATYHQQLINHYQGYTSAYEELRRKQNG